MVYFKGIDNSYTLNCLEIYGCVYYSRNETGRQVCAEN